ncbi:hypothetical protein EW026_g7666, partial [Hermanssonia centrifuga]
MILAHYLLAHDLFVHNLLILVLIVILFDRECKINYPELAIISDQ